MIKDQKLQNLEPLDVRQDIAVSPHAVVSRTLLEGPSGTVTLFAFDKGQALSKHSAPFDAGVAVAEGELEIEIGDKTVTVGAGRYLIMPAGIPHALKALAPSKMLLSMFKA